MWLLLLLHYDYYCYCYYKKSKQILFALLFFSNEVAYNAYAYKVILRRTI